MGKVKGLVERDFLLVGQQMDPRLDPQLRLLDSDKILFEGKLNERELFRIGHQRRGLVSVAQDVGGNEMIITLGTPIWLDGDDINHPRIQKVVGIVENPVRKLPIMSFKLSLRIQIFESKVSRQKFDEYKTFESSTYFFSRAEFHSYMGLAVLVYKFI